MEKNKVLHERVGALAKRYKCTPGQLARAWVLHQGDDVVPIPGWLKFFGSNSCEGVVRSKQPLDRCLLVIKRLCRILMSTRGFVS